MAHTGRNARAVKMLLIAWRVLLWSRYTAVLSFIRSNSRGSSGRRGRAPRGSGRRGGSGRALLQSDSSGVRILLIEPLALEDASGGRHYALRRLPARRTRHSRRRRPLRDVEEDRLGDGVRRVGGTSKLKQGHQGPPSARAAPPPPPCRLEVPHWQASRAHSSGSTAEGNKRGEARSCISIRSASRPSQSRARTARGESSRRRLRPAGSSLLHHGEHDSVLALEAIHEILPRTAAVLGDERLDGLVAVSADELLAGGLGGLGRRRVGIAAKAAKPLARSDIR